MTTAVRARAETRRSARSTLLRRWAHSPRIEDLAPGLTRISLRGSDVINVYLLDGHLVDAGARFTAQALIACLADRPLTAHVLTHGHFDHQGASAAVCGWYGIPLWCGEGDRAAVESGDLAQLMPHPGPLVKLLDRVAAGPPHAVARVLHEGDELGGFTVLETPGHTPGHLAFWREHDRVLVLGDVLFHRNPVTLRRGLAEPFPFATYDRALNRASIRRLAALRPALVCFGHGPPLRSPAALTAFAAGLA